jgi:hypothetical protein
MEKTLTLAVAASSSMVETLAIVTICNAFLKSYTKTFEIFQGQVQAPFSS